VSADVSVQAASGRRRREASARQILDGTRRLLADGAPVAKLTIDRIVDEAGVSRATFYACFTDKHELIGRLAQESLAWRNEIHAEILADGELNRGRLDELLRVIVAHWRANKPVLSAAVELAEHDAAINEAYRSAIGEIAEQASEQFRLRWAQDPVERPDDPDALATAFTWMLERLCHQVVEDDESAETAAYAISEILWRTLTYRQT
jgi:AcrR family transcriptional regulator